MREYQYRITREADGVTVGEFLRRRAGYSARAITRLKQTPVGLRVNGTHTRTVDRLNAGDLLQVTMTEPEKTAVPSSRAVELLYEDADLLIYNKPPAMPCHTSCGHAADTLENVYAAYCLRAGEVPRFRALNRLDRDTSGCVLAARNQFVASRLKGRFEKIYRAIVAGRVEEGGTVDAPIFRPDPVDMRRVVDARGQRAVTDYRVLLPGETASFLEFRLHTGRTHQIRVHMAHIGRPVLGDALYGAPSPDIGRQALHCASMSFEHPITGKAVEVNAGLPRDMARALERWFGPNSLR